MNWAPKSKENEEYVGFFEATIIGEKSLLAYYTFKPYQRVGFAKEGVLAIIDYVQKLFDIKTFVLEMDTRNRPSVRLAEALGFTWKETRNNVCELKGFQSHEFLFELSVNAVQT